MLISRGLTVRRQNFWDTRGEAPAGGGEYICKSGLDPGVWRTMKGAKYYSGWHEQTENPVNLLIWIHGAGWGLNFGVSAHSITRQMLPTTQLATEGNHLALQLA